ncbi:MAG TPA: zinc-binding dehydrogenase, partial [Amycolatopsis sp.]
MPTAVQVTKTGGPEVLEPAEVDVRAPEAGELLVDVAAAGVNYIDTYQRQGIYPMDVPFVLGLEGAGTVVEAGAESGFAPGDRVAWQGSIGSYAARKLVPASVAVKVPEGVSLETAAATMLQGMTAHYLVASTFEVKPGHDVLIHAAAGGVGLLLVQLAKARGARVIGTVSTEEKAKLAREAGADEVIRYDREDFAKITRDL